MSVKVHGTVQVALHNIDLTEGTDEELQQLRRMVDAELSQRHPPSITLTPVEECLVEGGFVINAIKLIRDRIDPRPTLRQVKDACDAYRNENMVKDGDGKWRRK